MGITISGRLLGLFRMNKNRRWHPSEELFRPFEIGYLTVLRSKTDRRLTLVEPIEELQKKGVTGWRIIASTGTLCLCYYSNFS